METRAMSRTLVFSVNEQAEVACCFDIITSAVVRVAHLEDLPDIETY